MLRLIRPNLKLLKTRFPKMFKLDLSESNVYIWSKTEDNDIIIGVISRDEFLNYCFYDEEYENDY